MNNLKVKGNIYLNREGLHRGKPDGCRITGQVVTTINGKVSKVNQCNKTKPHPNGYILVRPKKRSVHYRKRHMIKKQETPVKQK